MKEMFLDNLVPEERKTIILVVCISDKPVKDAPTREEAIGPLTLFHRKERCPGNTTRRYEAEKGFLCVTFALPERREGGDAETLPAGYRPETEHPECARVENKIIIAALWLWCNSGR